MTMGRRSGTETIHHRWHRAVTPTLALVLSDLVQRTYGLQRRRAWRMVSGGIVWGLCLVAASAGLGQAEVLQTTLDNGLTVLLEENHPNPLVSVHVFVRPGSMYEQESLGSGISHFFE